jgi:bacterioferritin-associated ferredoxin
MIQGIIVALIFTGAIAYLAWIVYKQLQAKAGCSSGCGKCSVVDFKKIESELKTKGL